MKMNSPSTQPHVCNLVWFVCPHNWQLSSMKYIQHFPKNDNKATLKSSYWKTIIITPLFCSQTAAPWVQKSDFYPVTDRKVKRSLYFFSYLAQRPLSVSFSQVSKIAICPLEGSLSLTSLSQACFAKLNANTTWAWPSQVHRGWAPLIWECSTATVGISQWALGTHGQSHTPLAPTRSPLTR